MKTEVDVPGSIPEEKFAASEPLLSDDFPIPQEPAPKPCTFCGCTNPDRCQHCGHCKTCGVEMPLLPYYPWWYPAYAPWYQPFRYSVTYPLNSWPVQYTQTIQSY